MNLNCSAGDETCDEMTTAVLETIGLKEMDQYRRPQPLISSETKAILDIYINCTMFMIASLVGIMANIVNIVVYWKLGLKDSITLGFFALSCSDFLLVLMTFATSVLYVARTVMPENAFDLQSIHYVSSATFRNLCYSMSSDLTAFLSVERCCCVIVPFKVKIIFSRARSAAIILVIVSFHCLSYLTLFATHRLGSFPKFMPNGNETMVVRYVLLVYFLPHRQEIEQVNTIMSGIVTPTVSQATVTVCIIILIHGLRASAKFRKSIGNTASTTHQSGVNYDPYEKSCTNKGQGLEEQTTAKYQLSNRDARLVRTMILLVIIFSISNVPLLVITYTKRVVPEFNFRKAYHNTATLTYSVVYLLSSINATANVLVYYKTSTRFRDMARSLFFCKTGLCCEPTKG